MLKRLACTTAAFALVAAGGQALAATQGAPSSGAAAPASPAAPATGGASTTATPATSSAPAAPVRSPQAAPPANQTEATGAGGAATAANGAPVTAGLAVKDNTGAMIGQVTDVKPGPDGKPVAVIKMGASTFSVDADKLAVANGAASINATQAQLQSMLHASGAGGGA